MKEIIVNLDDICSIKDALSAYRSINENDYSHIIQGEITVPLENILFYPSTPSLGFKRGILPEYLSNIRVDNTRLYVEVLFSDKLNMKTLNEKRDTWDEVEGYSTKKSLVSFEIINSKSETIASYKRDKIIIDRNYLNEFIDHLKD
ncbi:hypothetical protein HN652_01005 [archaeon]|jgi:hypothetical protein|nr:hypothetical protein [archaeon]MBT6868930.1 hypothetical protein [archaeon]MBT7192849.1 hypothetical protein [archaeon]MBT7380815.1 hypothetical protein [archaeon]MBT7507570.1 hypothetical protein [archaeon]